MAIRGRKVGVLAADGVGATALQAARMALAKASAKASVQAARLGDLRSPPGGPTVPVEHLLVTMPSVVFDAVYVAGERQSADALMRSSNAVHYVREGFKRAKAIAASSEVGEFLVAAGVTTASGPGLPSVTVGPFGSDGGSAKTPIAAITAHRHCDRASAHGMAA